MTRPAALLFSARIASGKSTVSTLVAQRLGWPRAAFGDYLRSLATNRGLDLRRETLQELGETLVRSDLDAFCRAVLKNAGWNGGTGLIVDGIRHAETIPVLKSIVNPLPVFLIFIDVSEPIRRERLQTRGVSPEEAHRIEGHATERQVPNTLRQIADLQVDGTEPPDALSSKIVLWLRQRMDQK